MADDDIETMSADALRTELRKAREQLAAGEKSQAELLTQLTSRCEKLVTTQLELDSVRDTLVRVQRDAPDFLGQRLEEITAAKRDLERRLQKAEETAKSKQHELDALESLVTRFQLELSSQASAVATSASRFHELADRAGKWVSDELYENERQYNVLGWSPKLQADDRPHFSDRAGKVELDKATVRPPDGWQYCDADWVVAPAEGDAADKGGWSYAPEFRNFHTGDGVTDEPGEGTLARRRRWVRRRMQTHDDSLDDVGNKVLEFAFEAASAKSEVRALRKEIDSLKAASAKAATGGGRHGKAARQKNARATSTGVPSAAASANAGAGASSAGAAAESGGAADGGGGPDGSARGDGALSPAGSESGAPVAPAPDAAAAPAEAASAEAAPAPPVAAAASGDGGDDASAAPAASTHAAAAVTARPGTSTDAPAATAPATAAAPKAGGGKKKGGKKKGKARVASIE